MMDANLWTAREAGMIAANVAAGPGFNAHAEEFLARFAGTDTTNACAKNVWKLRTNFVESRT